MWRSRPDFGDGASPAGTARNLTRNSSTGRNLQPLLFSNQAFVLFLFLQALDVLTTVLGIRLGAQEGSFFIARIMKFGTVPALLMAKAISIILVAAVVAFGRKRLLYRLNLWYAGLVTWNFIIIFLAARQ